MSVAVVDRLEVIQIDHQQRYRLPPVARFLEHQFEVLVEMRAVVQAGQPVATAGIVQPAVGVFELHQRAADFLGALRHLAFQLHRGFGGDALVLVAQRCVPVAQRDRQQQHFQRRPDLHAVFGEHVLGHQSERERRDGRGTGQEHRPGGEEQPRRPVAAAQHHHGGDHGPQHADDHRARGPRRGDAVRQPQRRCAQHGADADDRKTDDIAAREALRHFQERPRELLHADDGEADRQRHRHVRQPRVVRPQVFEAVAVQREQHQAERGDMEQIPEIAGIAQRQPQHEVVDEQREQDAVIESHHELRIARQRGEGRGRVQLQRHLHRTLALRAQQDVDRLARRQFDAEIRMAIRNAARRERQQVAAGLLDDAAIGIAQEQIDAVDQRETLHQHPMTLVGVVVHHRGVEPVGALLEAERGLARRHRLEAVDGDAPPGVVGGVDRVLVVQIAQMRGERQRGGAFDEFCRRLRIRGPGRRRAQQLRSRDDHGPKPDTSERHATPLRPEQA